MPDRESRSRVVQVSNISPSASREQLHHMFSYLGRIDELKVYPTETSPLYASAVTKLCYIKFEDSDAAAAALHMTNTPMIDRALICVTIREDRIPDETTALKMGGPALPGQRMLPSHIITQIQMVGNQQLMITVDPTMTTMGVPNYPPLPANTDASKLEEIRRTVYVGNIPKDAAADELLDFFNNNVGEVMYMRFAGSDDLPVRYMYVEFTNQISVPLVLQKNGVDFKGSKLKIQHSTVAIVKPRAKTQDMAKQEVEEALRKAEAAGPGGKALTPDTDEAVRRFSARSSIDALATAAAIRAVAGSRSPSRNRDDRGRSGRRTRSRTRSPPTGGRFQRSSSRRRFRPSRSPRRTRSPSPRRRASRDRDRDRNRRSSRDRVDRSDRDRDRDKDRDKDRVRDRDTSRRTRRSRSASASRQRRRSRDKVEKKKSRSRDRSGDRNRDKDKEKKDKDRQEKDDKDRKDKDKEKRKETNATERKDRQRTSDTKKPKTESQQKESADEKAVLSQPSAQAEKSPPENVEEESKKSEPTEKYEAKIVAEPTVSDEPPIDTSRKRREKPDLVEEKTPVKRHRSATPEKESPSSPPPNQISENPLSDHIFDAIFGDVENKAAPIEPKIEESPASPPTKSRKKEKRKKEKKEKKRKKQHKKHKSKATPPPAVVIEMSASENEGSSSSSE